jgi:hypothetical protein
MSMPTEQDQIFSADIADAVRATALGELAFPRMAE